jgi:hypothetical protein
MARIRSSEKLMIKILRNTDLQPTDSTPTFQDRIYRNKVQKDSFLIKIINRQPFKITELIEQTATILSLNKTMED